MKKIEEIFIVLENRPSTLGELCRHLVKNGINIEAIGVFQDSAKLSVNNPTKAMKVLSKYDYITEVREVLRLELANEPGALAEVALKLGNKGINIEYCYGTLTKKAGTVSVIMDVTDIDRAVRILEK